jgi:hypothetical protein
VSALGNSFGAAAALFAFGCHSCEEERPYTPFQISSSGSPSASVPVAASTGAVAIDSGRAFAPSEALTAVGEARRLWTLNGLRLTAPNGQELDRGFVADLDGDGAREAVVWTSPAKATDSERAALWLFRQSTKPLKVAEVPAFVPAGPDCELQVRLWHSGPHTATLEAKAACASPLIPRSPIGAVVVVEPLSERPIVFTLRLAEAAPGERLATTVDTMDRDGDGRDDVRVQFELSAREGDRPAAAPFLWLDRAAGLARDPAEPGKAFRDIGSVEMVRAKGLQTSRQVRGHVENAIRLFASICSEGAVPRVFDADGGALPCGELSQAFEWYAEAQLLAAVTMKDPLDALAVLVRDGWYHRRMSDKAHRRMLEALRASVPSVRATAQVLDLAARQRGSEPRQNPVRFETDGTLLVMTTTGIERFDTEGASLGSAEEEVDPWPLTVIGPEGNRWVGLSFPCDRNEASLLTTAPDGAPLPSVPTTLLAPRPGGCGRGTFPEPGPPSPLTWTAQSHQVLVAGGVVAPLGESDDPGKDARFALATPFGLYVTGGAGPTLWDVPDAQTFGQCTVSADGRRVACATDQGKVRLISKSPE